MTTYLLTIGLILILLMGWVVVQRAYRLFAQRHPELGPFRREGGGCGCCSGSCGGGSCDTSTGH
jgi:hypothetical protein